MNINPMKLMQMKQEWKRFEQRHPRLPKFFEALAGRGLSEGTVVELQVKLPDGEMMESNIRLTAEDVKLIRELREQIQAIRG